MTGPNSGEWKCSWCRAHSPSAAHHCIWCEQPRPFDPDSWRVDNGREVAAELLSGPLAALLAERDKAVAQVAAVRELVEQREQSARMSPARQFGGAPFPASVGTDALRRVLGDA